MKFTFYMIFASLLIACTPGQNKLEDQKISTNNEVTIDAIDKIVRSSDQVDVSYSIYGSGEPTIVLIHGWACDKSYWNKQIDYFKNNYKVIAIDLGGHGKSSIGEREDWTIPSFAADVDAVLQAESILNPILVGHSLGAMVVVLTADLEHVHPVAVIAVDYIKDRLQPMPAAAVAGMNAGFEADFKTATMGFVKTMFREDTDTNLLHFVLEDMSIAPSEVAISASTDLMTRDFNGALQSLQLNGIKSFAINSDYRPVKENYIKDTLGFESIIIEDSHHFLMMDQVENFNAVMSGIIKKLTLNFE